MLGTMKNRVVRTSPPFAGRAAPVVTGGLLALALGLHASASPAEPPAPRRLPPIVQLTHGRVADFRVSGFATSADRGRIEVRGAGPCRFHADIYDLAKPSSLQHSEFRRIVDPGTLPVVFDDIPPLPRGSYRAYLMVYDEVLCAIKGPDPTAGGWYVDFKVAQASGPAGAPAASTGPTTPPQSPGGATAGAAKPATGKLAALSVPGGSFAEDDAQKLLATGQGGCGFDLSISDKSYGGTYEKTWPVLPRKLDGGATLYNGTHFGTLAEGSYHAVATGTGGCTGTGAIDFKVTPKTSTKKVLGIPTVGFDREPKSGGVFSASKDGNIWFKVTLPKAVKDEPYAGCCDVEFDYQNEFGGWEPLPNSPFQDASYGLAVTQPAGVVNKSVSGFTNGTVWRVKVRAYKFKTEFEWSDWLQFRVDSK
jgi:hypothetical protein